MTCEQAGAEPVLRGMPDGVEAVRRGDVVFVLDHQNGTVDVRPVAVVVSQSSRADVSPAAS